MIPVHRYRMLEFLDWLIKVHPEIRSIKNLSTEQLLALADEFDCTKRNPASSHVRGHPIRVAEWKGGFNLLLGHDGINAGLDRQYEEARKLAMELSWHVNETRLYYDDEPPSDPVRRYRGIPLHGMFMYSREDVEFSEYIRSNWRALDRMSGDFCDLYPSIDQLCDLEDVYSVLNSPTKLVRGMCSVELSHLPGIMFWDKQEKAEYISFTGRNDPVAIRESLRVIFHHIRQRAVMQSVAEARAQLQLLDRQRTESREYSVTIIDSQGVQIGNAGQQENKFAHRTARQERFFERFLRRSNRPPAE